MLSWQECPAGWRYALCTMIFGERSLLLFERYLTTQTDTGSHEDHLDNQFPFGNERSQLWDWWCIERPALAVKHGRSSSIHFALSLKKRDLPPRFLSWSIERLRWAHVLTKNSKQVHFRNKENIVTVESRMFQISETRCIRNHICFEVHIIWNDCCHSVASTTCLHASALKVSNTRAWYIILPSMNLFSSKLHVLYLQPTNRLYERVYLVTSCRFAKPMQNAHWQPPTPSQVIHTVGCSDWK